MIVAVVGGGGEELLSVGLECDADGSDGDGSDRRARGRHFDGGVTTDVSAAGFDGVGKGSRCGVGGEQSRGIDGSASCDHGPCGGWGGGEGVVVAIFSNDRELLCFVDLNLGGIGRDFEFIEIVGDDLDVSCSRDAIDGCGDAGGIGSCDRSCGKRTIRGDRACAGSCGPCDGFVRDDIAVLIGNTGRHLCAFSRFDGGFGGQDFHFGGGSGQNVHGGVAFDAARSGFDGAGISFGGGVGGKKSCGRESPAAVDKRPCKGQPVYLAAVAIVAHGGELLALPDHKVGGCWGDDDLGEDRLKGKCAEVGAIGSFLACGAVAGEVEIIGGFVDEERIGDHGVGAIDAFVGGAGGIPDQVVFAGGHIGGAAVVEVCAGGVVFGDDVVLDGDYSAAGTDVCVKSIVGVEGDRVVIEQREARSVGRRDVHGVGAGVSVDLCERDAGGGVVGVEAVGVAVNFSSNQREFRTAACVESVLCGVGDLDIACIEDAR